MKALLGINDLSDIDLAAVLDGSRCAPEPNPNLVVANLFFEASTRTRLSFEMAARRFNAMVLDLNPDQSSVSKGESVVDTAATLGALGANVVVVRHGEAGVPGLVHQSTGLRVINAGDGIGEHPTQALADAWTLKQRFGGWEGLRVAVVGDLAHSRVLGSLELLLSRLGVEVTLVGDAEMAGERFADRVVPELDEVVAEVDCVYLLRWQQERGVSLSPDRYRRFQMNPGREQRMSKDAIIMHPGPINRGVEITEEVADSPRSVMLDQVRAGVEVRTGVFSLICEDLA